MKEWHFSIHGMDIKVVTDVAMMGEALDSLFRPFSCPEVPASIDLRIDLFAVPDLNHIPSTIVASKWNPIPRKGKVNSSVKRMGLTYDLYQDQDLMVADFHQHGLILVDGPGGEAQAYLVRPELMDLEMRLFFVGTCVSELLRQKGLYLIHAVALERFGKGIMIAGKPGLGKTTAGLSLLRSGYGFISDDFPFIRSTQDRVELLTFQDRIDVREKTLGFFPELHTISHHRRDGSKKDSFFLKDLFPGSHVNSCECHVLLFPQVVSEKKSHLEPMPKHLALQELLPQGLLIHDKETAKREFQTYSKLVETAACFRLHYGEDRWDLATVLDPILDGSGNFVQPLCA